jgi:hypothetical protein
MMMKKEIMMLLTKSRNLYELVLLPAVLMEDSDFFSRLNSSGIIYAEVLFFIFYLHIRIIIISIFLNK